MNLVELDHALRKLRLRGTWIQQSSHAKDRAGAWFNTSLVSFAEPKSCSK